MVRAWGAIVFLGVILAGCQQVTSEDPDAAAIKLITAHAWVTSDSNGAATGFVVSFKSDGTAVFGSGNSQGYAWTCDNKIFTLYRPGIVNTLVNVWTTPITSTNPSASAFTMYFDGVNYLMNRP